MEQNLSVEVLKGKILLEANAANYQKLLQGIEDISFDKNDLKADQPDLVALSAIEKRIKAIKNPHTEAWKQWNKVYADILDPITTGLNGKRNEFAKLAVEIKNEQIKVDNENTRIASIKTTIQNKSIEFSQKIASCENVNELVLIEKNIGSEKNRKNIYQEFTSELIEELDKLRPLITKQKEAIKKLSFLEEKSETSSDKELMQIEEEKDSVKNEMEFNKTKVQQQVLSQAVSNAGYVNVESTVVAPKAKRTTWEYEIYDFKTFSKYYPEFVKCEANEAAIKLYLRDLKEKKEIRHQTMFGLKIYQKETY
jgi:hypothetical protein